MISILICKNLANLTLLEYWSNSKMPWAKMNSKRDLKWRSRRCSPTSSWLVWLNTYRRSMWIVLRLTFYCSIRIWLNKSKAVLDHQMKKSLGRYSSATLSLLWTFGRNLWKKLLLLSMASSRSISIVSISIGW